MYKKVVFFMMICAAFAFGKALAMGVQIGPSKPVLSPEKRDALALTPIVQRTLPSPVALDQLESAWRDWMVTFDVSASSIAIGRDGKILHSRGAKRSPSTGFPMASLSKSITAQCLNELLEESPYDWNATLTDLKPVLARLNLSPGKAMMGKTLSQFATHTSGLPKILFQGKTSMRKRNLDSQSAMTRTALTVPANFDAETGFTYSNANYAILGSLIAALSDKTYAQTCKARIMVPAGAKNAHVSGQMARTGGYGGWLVSVEDYVRYAMYWFAPSKPWVQTPQAYPFETKYGYGLGVYTRHANGGYSFHHGGSWRHSDRRRANLGAFMIVGPDGTAIVVNWDKRLPKAAYSHLFDVFSMYL